MERLSRILTANAVDAGALRLLFELDRDQVFALTEDGYDVCDLWNKLRILVAKTGCWPVILGRVGEEDSPTKREFYDPRTRQTHRETFPTTESILAEAEVIDAAWFEAQHRQRLDDLEDEVRWSLEKGYEEDAEHLRGLLAGPEVLRGIPREKWPEHVEPNSPWAVGAGITHDQDMKSYPVTIGLLPYPESWKAPAVMKFGGWNSCPPPHEHCSVMRYWEEKFGAQLACMTGDTVEFMVSKPPRTKQEALLLARDHYHYCIDCIEQGDRSLDRRAAGLLNGESWYFWWD